MGDFKLFDDESFHFETLRILHGAKSNGADIAEVFMTIPKIKAGDFDSWAKAWYDLAVRVEAQAQRSDTSTASGRVSARNAYFRAACYYRSADFFLHGNPSDPRIMAFWKKHLETFDAAIALLPIPGRRIDIPTPHGFHVPAIFYEAPGTSDGTPKPTMILGNGYDGSQEEMYHAIGAAALERGFNAISYEGPGQPTVRRYQGLGFIPEWEKVLTPVVDYLHKHASELHVDVSKLGLWGNSMAGMLGLRAVAFEKRIKAYIACDGVWNLNSAFPAEVKAQMQAGHSDRIWASIKDGSAPTGLRWMITHGLWAMYDEGQNRALESTSHVIEDFVTAMGKYNVEDIVGMVDCKVFVGEAEEDIFFKGQPKLVADALGSKATLYYFRSEDGAGAHCQEGAAHLLSQATLDWFEDVVRGRAQKI